LSNLLKKRENWKFCTGPEDITMTSPRRKTAPQKVQTYKCPVIFLSKLEQFLHLLMVRSISSLVLSIGELWLKTSERLQSFSWALKLLKTCQRRKF